MVGRPIRNASDPLAVVKQIQEQMGAARLTDHSILFDSGAFGTAWSQLPV